MSLAIGDILELKILGTLIGEKVMTVLHYRIESVTPLGSEFSDTSDILAEIVAATAGADPLLSILSCQADNYTRNTVHLQKVAPTRSIYLSEVSVASGTIAESCTNPNICGVLTKRGSAGGRRGIGGIHIPGLPPSGSFDGLVAPAYQVLMNNAQTDLLAGLSTTSPLCGMVPVIFNPGATPNFQTIVELLTQPVVRTMHRRTVGLGI